MNFLRTQSLMRIADTLKVKLNGVLWKTQSNLNVVGGRNVTFTQVETKDTSTLTLDVGANGKLGWWGNFYDTTTQTLADAATPQAWSFTNVTGASNGVTISANGSSAKGSKGADSASRIQSSKVDNVFISPTVLDSICQTV